MRNFSGKQIAIVAVPIVLIAVALPVAIIVLADRGGNDNETRAPEESTAVAGEQAPLPANATKITLQDLEFVPDEVTVDLDTPIAFVNDDNSQHTATVKDSTAEDDDNFDSDIIDPGSQVIWIPKSAGEYQLECRIHPNLMQLTVTVRAAGGS
jgi:plastocyanin